MRVLSIILFILLIAPATHAQKVQVVLFEQLQQRYTQTNDTVYVVNFWATWCGPCVKELAYFDSLQLHYRATKTKILLVSLDFKSKLSSTVIPFVNNRAIQSEVLLLDESNANTYIDKVSTQWSGAIPATVFCKNGKQLFLEQEFVYTELEKTYLSFLSNSK